MFDTRASSIAEYVDSHQVELVDAINKSLRDLMYEHRSYLRPSLLPRVAQAEARCFLDFLQQSDIVPVQKFASRSAQDGMGIQGALRIIATVDQFCHTALEPDVARQSLTNIVRTYSDAYIEGFIEGRESIILEEQERIRAAMQRSVNHNNRWLQTAAEVSRVATSTLNLSKLMTDAVSLIRMHFDFYNVSLFLLDDEHEWATLRASTGTGTTSRLISTYKVAVAEDNIIGKCAVSGEAQIVVDVGIQDFHLDDTILADTSSAMILPLVSRQLVIGVIVIQSLQIAAFGEDDITRLQTVADQLANAIQNVRLYEEMEAHSQTLAQAVKTRTLELEKTKERVEAILNNSPDAILLLKPDGTIDLCNNAFFEMFGHSTSEIMGRPIHDLVEETQTDLIDVYLKNSLVRGETNWFQITAQRKDETTFDASGALATISDTNTVTALVCSLRDISEQVQTEAQIKASLREKEVLLREIHHRVKNNMQVISSLMALQAGYTTDETSNQMFRESQNRIRSMALVHELLYQSDDLAKIDFVEYVHKLTRHLLHSYLADVSRIKLDIISDAVFLDVDMAVPCGLIINELISNALKHAFPNNRSGSLSVELRTDGNGLHTILVRDDGIGIPPNLDVHKTESLGLQLVTSLAGQLNATIGLLRYKGTTFEIRFALPESQN